MVVRKYQKKKGESSRFPQKIQIQVLPSEPLEVGIAGTGLLCPNVAEGSGRVKSTVVTSAHALCHSSPGWECRKKLYAEKI
jgi:hypothetical protein